MRFELVWLTTGESFLGGLDTTLKATKFECDPFQTRSILTSLYSRIFVRPSVCIELLGVGGVILDCFTR